MKKIKILLALIFVIVLFLLYSSTYLPISGIVVDEETGKPIAGAVVLVEWTKKVGIGDYHTESVKVVETVTDKEGKFKASGIFNIFVDAPDVTIYKKGYVAWNNKWIFPAYEKRKDFTWESGYVIRLAKFKEGYSFIKHQSFIDMVASLSSTNEKKKQFIKAYEEWEEKEVLTERNRR